MLRITGMPLLPGTLFRDTSKCHHPKQQTLLTRQGMSTVNDRDKEVPPPTDAIVDVSCPSTAVASLYPPQSGPALPAWLVYEKKVLRFFAYFKQTLHEVIHAPYLVRKVKIHFYLEDGTLEISEPPVRNSGIVQGCLLHRMRVPRPPPCQNEFITMMDLNVDMTVEIFDRHFHIYDCDPFTRDFLNRRGIVVPDRVSAPMDPTESWRNRPKPPLPEDESKYLFAQFLKFDRQVLRFYGYWDDRTEYGDVRRLEICYYLADDTIDIKEAPVRNSGREGTTLFLKRMRLPRDFNGLMLPGQQAPKTILNVLGTSLSNARYCTDPLNVGNKTIAYYAENDLQIGTVLNVYGRSVVIIDMDQFTRDYYRARFGIENFTPLQVPRRNDDPHGLARKERLLPPYNGWGSYEDSVSNCIAIVPKKPQKDFRKFVKLDRYVLRFGAKMLSTIKENCDRIFIISYFLADDTMSITEIAIRNSGFLGGEFMKRIRLELPGQEKFSCRQPQYYLPINFFIGATVSLKDFIFHIVSADEYTLLYMEHHPHQFAVACIETIMNKVSAAILPRLKEFVGSCAPKCADNSIDGKPDVFVTYESFKGAIISIMGNSISDHEIITLCRRFSAERAPPPLCSRDKVRATAHLELKRSLWNARDDLMEHFHHINPMNLPFLPIAKVRSAIRGCRLPFSLELIDNILSVLNRNDCDEIEICDLMNFIDVSCGKGCELPPINIAFELCPKMPFLTQGRMVNLTCFICHMKEMQKPSVDPYDQQYANYRNTNQQRAIANH